MTVEDPLPTLRPPTPVRVLATLIVSVLVAGVAAATTEHLGDDPVPQLSLPGPALPGALPGDPAPTRAPGSPRPPVIDGQPGGTPSPAVDAPPATAGPGSSPTTGGTTPSPSSSSPATTGTTRTTRTTRTTTTTTTTAPEDPIPPGRDLGRDLRAYLALKGDQVVVVPSGAYTAGTSADSRPATAGPYRGWLILVAEQRGGVVVDLSRTGLQLLGDAAGEGMRVMFVGFRFVNGLTRIEGADHVRFWYCDFTFPPERWQEQYVAAGGTPGKADTKIRDRMANPFPSALRIMVGGKGTPAGNADIGIFGSDIHDVGDDGVFLTAVRNMALAGVRIWNVREKSYDPADWWHNDAVQTTGGVNTFDLVDSMIGHVQWGAQLGNIQKTRAAHLWLLDSEGVGWLNDAEKGFTLTKSSQEDIVAWANGQTRSGYDPTFDRFRVDILDGSLKVWQESHGSNRLVMPATGITEGTPPAGIAPGAGLSAALTHPSNPALQWRAKTPYGSFASAIP